MSASDTPILVITGPTASGKSSLAIDIARQYGGEIVSADSRQIYRGMDIGTGKVTPKEQSLAPHHLLDIRGPEEDYNVTDFQRDARTAIQDIRNRGGLPIVCGGTVFWIQALVESQTFPAVPPDPSLRAGLADLPADVLFGRLEALDPGRATTIDRHNPRRLVRAIEIASAQGRGSAPQETQEAIVPDRFEIVVLDPPIDILREKIRVRLESRFDHEDMIGEVRRLHEQGLPWERLETFGLEYRWIARFLEGHIGETDMREGLYYAIVHYAKRQRTWLGRWERQGASLHRFSAASDAIGFVKKERTVA